MKAGRYIFSQTGVIAVLNTGLGSVFTVTKLVFLLRTFLTVRTGGKLYLRDSVYMSISARSEIRSSDLVALRSVLGSMLSSLM